MPMTEQIQVRMQHQLVPCSVENYTHTYTDNLRTTAACKLDTQMSTFAIQHTAEEVQL